jgi:sugar lactone lactonase YvrE
MTSPLAHTAGRQSLAILAFTGLALLSSCAGGGSGEPEPARLLSYTGTVSGRGNVDGVGSVARFDRPHAVALDASGHVYVADTHNYVVRKVSPAGVVTTLAGSPGVQGTADGRGSLARFGQLYGIAVDGTGHVYVTDTYAYAVRKITPDGDVSTLAGNPGLWGDTDGVGAAARFRAPAGIVVDSTGTLYVSDVSSHVIRRITPTGVVTTIAGSPTSFGDADGTGATARFNFPAGLAIDSAGDLYVGDSNNGAIRKVTRAGVVTTVAGVPGSQGHVDGTVATARFTSPMGVAFDRFDNLYVADAHNQAIRKITPAGVVTTLAGTGARGNTNGPGTQATFFQPQGIASDPEGTVHVADTFNHSVRRISGAGDVTTVAGDAGTVGATDGLIASASFDAPSGLAIGPHGDLYLADRQNHSVRRVTPAGVVSTIATGGFDPSRTPGDLTYPYAVAADAAGNLYVADSHNHVIRKLTAMNARSTFACTVGTAGTADGPAVSAGFQFPRGIATDGAGNVYVADTFNHTIRKITPGGEVSTLAGTAGIAGYADGAGTAAGFTYPHGIAVDAAGNVYVADTYNHMVRKISPTGAVTTLAGGLRLPGDNNGPGAVARFNMPSGVAVDNSGNVYVADTENHTVRKIAMNGEVSTVVGVSGRAGFAAGPLPGLLAFPFGLGLRGRSLYITLNNGVAVVSSVP